MSDKIYIWQTSPNQKTVVTKKTESGAASPYGICNVAAVLMAAKALSDRAFKLYMRMNLHQDGHTYALSPVEINGAIGMSDKRYRDAVNELIDKGYLVQSDKHKALYSFYEFPQLDNKQSGLPISPDNPSEIGTSSTQNGRITRPFRTDNPSISGGEILHNITSHNTSDNTVNSNNMGYSLTDEYNAFVIQKEQEQRRKVDMASQIAAYDEDDARMYEPPELGGEHDTDLENELPF